MGGMWKILECQTREILEGCKQNSTGSSGGSLEDPRLKRNLDSEGTAHETSQGCGDSITKWDGGHSGHSMLAVLRQYPENSNEAELKSKGLMCLVEKLSRQESTEAVAWLLLITLTEGLQCKRTEGDGGYCLMYSLVRKRAQASLKLQPRQELKKRLKLLRRNILLCMEQYVKM